MANASLILNPIKQLWSAYEKQLERRPILTNMTTSAILWGAGDIIAQRLEYWEQQAQSQKALAAVAAAASKGKTVQGADPKSSAIVNSSDNTLAPQQYDWRRAFMTAMFGSTLVGPVGHFWYIALDKWCSRLVPGGGAAFIATKVVIDTAVLGPFYVAAFFAWGCALIDGSGFSELKRKMKTDFVPTLAAEMSFWPSVQAVNFSVVPLKHQLLVVNTMTILDACFMSWARNQEDWLSKVKVWIGMNAAVAAAQQQDESQQGTRKGSRRSS